MKGFLPEWKVYLWKKLLLGDYAPERAFHVADFVFFNEEARRQMFLDDAQRDINRLKVMEARARQGLGISDLDTGSALPSQDRWYSPGPKQVFVALAELGISESAPLKFESVRVSKNIVHRYRVQRKMYLENQEKKRLGSLPSGSPRSYSAPKIDDRFTDPWCGLPKSIYEKIEAEEDIHFAELSGLIQLDRVEGLVDSMTFKISVDKEKLSLRLREYIRDFENDELVAPAGVRPFGFRKQSDAILAAIEKQAQKLGSKNLSMTFEEIANSGGWIGDWNRYCFLETLLSLESAGRIKIKQLRGAEALLSVEKTDPVPALPVPLAEQSIDEQIRSTLKVTKKIKVSFVPKSQPGSVNVHTEAGADKIGYVVIDGARIPLGGIGTTKFALAEMLCSPKMGVSKTIDSVMQVVGPKSSKNAFSDLHIGTAKKLIFLRETTKEINRAITAYLSSKRIKDVSFRFALRTDNPNSPRSVHLEQKVGRGGK